MKKTKPYNITPAKGQALLSFQGRRFPDKIDIFEAQTLEKIDRRQNKQQPLTPPENNPHPDFTNLLIHGDCLSACAYLKQQNTKIDLVYIDPPFASGANYAKKIYLRNGGEHTIETDNSIGEEVMYGDIWQKEDYLNWLYERLLAIKEVMSETASIYVHLDWHIGHYVKVMMDEIFGEDNFVNEIIWHYFMGASNNTSFGRKHNTIFLYSKSEDYIFNRLEIGVEYNPETIARAKRGEARYNADIDKMEENGKNPGDVWSDVNPIQGNAIENVNYTTQKPEALLERIIKASSDEGMVVADFFSGSGTTAKVASSLNRQFIACDVGINAIQTTRDRLIKAKTAFDILKINDGLRLFRNPQQTTAQLFSIIDGFKTNTELQLNDFWHGGIAQPDGTYSPIKFIDIHCKLTQELLDVCCEEIAVLEDTTDQANEVIIIYAYKDSNIDNKSANKGRDKAELTIKLIALDELLSDKKGALFHPDNAEIKVTQKGKQWIVEIKKYFSTYLKNKIDDYNNNKTKKDKEQDELNEKASKTKKTKPHKIKISPNGLELIESVQFDTTLQDVWQSNPSLEDKAGIKEKIKGSYTLDTDKFKIKIRNIAGDEIIINADEIEG